MDSEVAYGMRTRAEADRALEVFDTAARYQMYHALAIMTVGLIGGVSRPAGRTLNLAGLSFIVGTLLFSGSLYALALSGMRWLGAITPFGGVGFLVGWLALAVEGARLARAQATENSVPGI
jgi:uncharacterized membrane protein YgdD (TMEM256/DUF423 family)